MNGKALEKAEGNALPAGRGHRRLLPWIASLLLTIALLEIVLHVQQRLGPLVELEFPNASVTALSDTLNHMPISRYRRRLRGRSMYGEHHGFSFEARYDHRGIRMNDRRPGESTGEGQMRILIMGDSFVEGYDDANTVPQHVWRYLSARSNGEISYLVMNAGHSSYSPCIYVPQARLLASTASPDIIVVDFDETDLGDDWARYRSLTERTVGGKISAVRSSCANRTYHEWLSGLRRVPFYTVRLLGKTYLYMYRLPAVKRRCGELDRDAMRYAYPPCEGADYRFVEEIAYFERNILELAQTLLEITGDRRRILFLFHPHPHHLIGGVDGCRRSLVRDAVARISAGFGIPFYDATGDCDAAFGDRPLDYFWRGDMHFNFEGLGVYGGLVAARIGKLIAEAGRADP